MIVILLLGKFKIVTVITIIQVVYPRLYYVDYNILLYRHVVFAPSSNNYYAGDAFPALVDAMYLIDDDPDQETRWNAVREQMAIIAFMIQSASSTLTDVTIF